MTWPWISRAVYMARHKEFLREREAHHTEMRDWAVRYDSLLEKYHALKLQGASIPEPTKTLERPEFDPVMAAITAKAGPDRRLRAQMSAEVMRSRQAGIDDVEIIRAIEQGVTIDDEAGIVL